MVTVKVIENYRDSSLGWIENLGVAPVFSLSRFLLRPTFFFFLALLLFVTRLLETIKNLSLNLIQHTCLLVKILFFFFSLGLYASIPQVVILSKGEVLEIKTEDTAKYTVTHRNIVSYKFFPQQKKMILKGKKRGISQIVFWKKSGKSHKLTIFVQSRKEQLSYAKFLPSLAALGAEFSLIGQKIEVKGVLKTLGDYEAFSKIINRQKKEFFILKISVPEKIIKEAVADIYFDFFQHYRDSISCRYKGFKITCHYYYFDKKEDELVKRFSKKYTASFTAYKRQYTTNFKITTKTLLIEGGQSSLKDLGIDKISTTIDEILSKDITNLFSEENIEIRGQNINIYTFNEQESLIRFNHPLEIKIGTDQRYHRVVNGESRTYWHFTGLRIHLVLKRLMGKFFVDYSTSLSSPSSDNLNKTNSKESSFFIPLGAYQKVFEVTTSSRSLTEDGIPLLNHIPVLQNLFKRKSLTNSNVIYRTYVKLEKI